MAWVSPTSFFDPDSKWADEALIYDGDTATPGVISSAGFYVELLLPSAILCDKVRIYAAKFQAPFFYDPNIAIDVFYGVGWNNIWDGTTTKQTWVEKAIGSNETVVKARIKFNSTGTVGFLYEFEFNEVILLGIARPKVGGSLAAGKRGLA
ncbi:hypothetical protein LCGC14_1776590 [marine sediment metagenome]|uniref:Uncharacterized protein n=1 Tax=marine sediment metagenome TaxID=412755 RepID=A0A0F9JBJ6_9ZZZZ